MYEEIGRDIERRLHAEPRLNVERIADVSGFLEEDRARRSEHITAELEGHLAEMFDEEDAEEARQVGNLESDFGGFRTVRQLRKHVTERLRADYTSSMNTMNTMDLQVTGGSRIFGPPYDDDWSEGNGIAMFSRHDGKVMTIPKTNGFSAAGIGFYLNAPNEPSLVSIIPQGTYDFSVSSFADLPFLRSRGGLGVAVYTDGEAQPTLARQPVLWSLSGVKAFSGPSGSGRIADAASPAFGLGTVPLAPVLINMVPGSRYLVWVWCWQTMQGSENDPFIAFQSFNMPFVTIAAGPPVIVR